MARRTKSAMKLRRQRIRLVQAKVPEYMYKELRARVQSGVYVSESEVVREALRGMFINESMETLQRLAKEAGVTKREMLAELRRIRRGK